MTSTAQPKVIVTVLYPRIPDLKFDIKYYLSSHYPRFTKQWAPHGLLKATVTEVTPDSEKYAINVLTEWESIEGWEAALKDKESENIAADVTNFTNAQPEFHVGVINDTWVRS